MDTHNFRLSRFRMYGIIFLLLCVFGYWTLCVPLGRHDGPTKNVRSTWLLAWEIHRRTRSDVINIQMRNDQTMSCINICSIHKGKHSVRRAIKVYIYISIVCQPKCKDRWRYDNVFFVLDRFLGSFCFCCISSKQKYFSFGYSMVGKDNGHRLNGCKIRTRYDALLNAYIRPFASDELRLFYYCCSLSRTVVQTSGVFGTFEKANDIYGKNAVMSIWTGWDVFAFCKRLVWVNRYFII